MLEVKECLVLIAVWVTVTTIPATAVAAGREKNGQQLPSIPALGHVTVAKRQVSSPELCRGVQTAALCTNGYYQEWINKIFQCDEKRARYLHKGCQIDPQGNYCLSSPLWFDNTICNHSAECTVQCRSHLIDLRNEAGCCLDILGVPSEVWLACYIEPTTPECPCNSTTLPVLEPGWTPCDAQRERQQKLLTNVVCNSTYNLDADKTISSTMGCEDYMFNETALSKCAVDETGYYCHSDVDLYNKVQSAQTACNSNTCDPTCKDALTKLQSLGCCLNVHNNSGTEGIPGAWSTYDLWTRCGLVTPGFCEERFTDGDADSSSADTGDMGLSGSGDALVQAPTDLPRKYTPIATVSSDAPSMTIPSTSMLISALLLPVLALYLQLL